MYKQVILMFGILLFLLGCQNNISPTAIPSATPIIRKWQAEPVLVELGTKAGTFGSPYALTPDFLLYSDGRLIISHHNNVTYNGNRTIMETRLSNTQMCQLLFQIDNSGFFDIKPNDYVSESVTDQDTTVITVSAWKKKSISAYALGASIAGKSKDWIRVPIGLEETYNRLRAFEITDGKAYEPNTVVLQVFLLDKRQEGEQWSLITPSLDFFLAHSSKSWNELVLEGEIAKQIYAMFDNDIFRIFNENGKSYHLAVRPLLPLEELDTFAYSYADTKRPFPSEPKTEMECRQ